MIEFLEIFLFGQGDPSVQMAEPLSAGIMIGGAALNIIGGIFGAGKAKKAERAARREKARLNRKLNYLENNRQAIINPAEGVTNLSGLAQDLSSQLSNPMANLSVATQAAEIQVEQADISLANTLDTIRATGSGAGGATALAQAALASKKGVSANIEQQEAQNERLRAQGEQQLQQQKLAEQQRIQGIQISEGGRVQGMEMQGRQFMFGAQESREEGKLDRTSAQLAGAEARQAQASADRTGALTGMIGGVTSLAGAGLTSGAFSGSAASLTPPNMTGMIYRSDRRLKKHIKIIGRSKSGLNIYSFEYIDKHFGKGTWQGVMSDEAPKEAVINNFSGIYDGVDYSKIDVEFKQI